VADELRGDREHLLDRALAEQQDAGEPRASLVGRGEQIGDPAGGGDLEAPVHVAGVEPAQCLDGARGHQAVDDAGDLVRVGAGVDRDELHPPSAQSPGRVDLFGRKHRGRDRRGAGQPQDARARHGEADTKALARRAGPQAVQRVEQDR
jgi:hypothetical protein